MPLDSDPCIYKNENTGVLIGVYVDDVLILGENKNQLDTVFKELAKHFEATNKGFPKSFLGLNVIPNSKNCITINQTGYVDKILKRFNLNEARTVKSPLNAGQELLKSTPFSTRCDQKLYQEIIGSLIHLALYSRPDISFAVSKLSQFNMDPSIEHLQAAKHVLRYLKLSRNYSITYGNGPLNHTGFSDADWASDKNDRKSFTGYIFLVNNGPVSWSSHKQSTIAQSTLEAEYMALSDASRECIARCHLYEELCLSIDTPIIYCDNLGSLSTAEDPTNYARSKHIDLRYHFIRHTIDQGTLGVDHVPGNENPADVLTKPLGPAKHEYLTELMGIRKDFKERA
jgi:Reverse transcriptase (RNA-dependent DNA polymerase)